MTRSKSSAIRSLVSKKLIVTLLTVALLAVNGHPSEALAAALAYLGVQGAIDHKTV